MADVRSGISAPVPSDFRASDGTPLFVDRVTGDIYIMDSADNMLKVGSAFMGVDLVLQQRTFAPRIPAIWGA